MPAGASATLRMDAKRSGPLKGPPPEDPMVCGCALPGLPAPLCLPTAHFHMTGCSLSANVTGNFCICTSLPGCLNADHVH